MADRQQDYLSLPPDRWDLLASAARAEIFEALRLQGPCSIAQIAEVLDRPADTLYRHVDVLRRAGFVQDAGLRKLGRNAEQVFDVVAEDFVVDFTGVSRADANAFLHRMSASMLRSMERAVRDSAAAGSLETGPENRNISMNYELGWLTPEQYQEVRGLIQRIKQIMDEGKKTRRGRLYMTLTMACPVTRKRHARGREPAGDGTHAVTHPDANADNSNASDHASKDAKD